MKDNNNIVRSNTRKKGSISNQSNNMNVVNNKKQKKSLEINKHSEEKTIHHYNKLCK